MTRQEKNADRPLPERSSFSNYFPRRRGKEDQRGSGYWKELI